MKKIILFILIAALTASALCAADYREMYKGSVFNFISRGEGFRGDGEEGERSEFVIRNAEKILAQANEGREDGDRLFIVQYIPGNFTGSGDTEVLVFFDEKSGNPEIAATVRLTKVFRLDGRNRIRSAYTVDYSDVIVFKYQTYDCPALGQRRFQGWVCDLNGNGRQELILEYGYLDFTSIRIIEFDGGALRDLLEFMEMNTKVLDADAETGTLFLEREVWDREALQYRKIRTRAVWNAAAGLYEETETATDRSIREFESGR